LSGHILGSAFITLSDGRQRIVFSGDLGRPNDALMVAPALIEQADYLVVESTYGDRTHATADPSVELASAIKRTIQRGGAVIVPAFAVGRTQSLLYYTNRLKREGAIPAHLPVFLNSPMASDVTALYRRFASQLRVTPDECEAFCRAATFINTIEESKLLNALRQAMDVVAASGTASAGGVIHHLKSFAPDPRNLILFSGYQAAGTRGAAMLNGADHVRIHGQDVPVRAEVAALPTLSAHADANETLQWLSGFSGAPRTTFITHGEPAAADALRARIERELGWNVRIPEHLQEFDLGN